MSVPLERASPKAQADPDPEEEPREPGPRGSVALASSPAVISSPPPDPKADKAAPAPAGDAAPTPAPAATTPAPAATTPAPAATTPAPPAPALAPARTRYFEDVTDLLVRTMDAVEGDDIIGWAHDRIDPDTMGANGLLWLLLRERWGKSYCCYYSKRMSFLMNRTLATNFMPAGVLRRCEQQDNLAEVALKAPLICILDATCPEIMTDFGHLIRRSKEVRQKPMLFIDHHRKGSSDVEDLPAARGIRREDGQATAAILLHVARNLGLDLRGSEDGFRLAVVCKAGIETDLIGVDPSGWAPSTVDALEYLDEVLGDRGREILARLKAIKHPLSWYRKLGETLVLVEQFDPTIAVAGLGVIDDTGIVPFVANRLMESGPFKTAIVFAIVCERIEGQVISVDLDASGRTSQDTEIVLPDLFHDIFFVTDQSGKKTSKGGGRSNALLGDYSGAGASVPLDYWRQLGSNSAEEKLALLQRLAWPAEFMRMRNLLHARMPALKVEEIRSVVPILGLDDLTS